MLSDDAERLLGPTTIAVRRRDALFDFQYFWVVNGQLSGLFGGAPAKLPFSAVSISPNGEVFRATEITLDGDFYPEGIASSRDGTLYIRSVALNTVVRVPANSTTPEPFVPAGVAAAGVIGMEVDDERGLLWLCDSDPRDMPRTGAVIGVSLDDGSEVVRHVLAAPDADSLFCNDLAIDDYNGDVWATESIAASSTASTPLTRRRQTAPRSGCAGAWRRRRQAPSVRTGWCWRATRWSSPTRVTARCSPSTRRATTRWRTRARSR